MLADPRRLQPGDQFRDEVADSHDAGSGRPRPESVPRIQRALRRDFSTEAQAFIGSVFSEDRSVVELLTADYTFLNDRLASHYGISGVTGAQFRKGHADRQNAFRPAGQGGGPAADVVRRPHVSGLAWSVGARQADGHAADAAPARYRDRPLTEGRRAAQDSRARLEQHRDKATCRMCHGVIDPTGLALENFDAIGQWRTRDSEANVPIDASTVLPTGVAINGVVELRAQLAARPDVFARTVTERLLMYAVNRRLEYFDMPQVRGIVRSAAKDNYTLSSIVLGIVNSHAFRRQGVDAAK
jgi:hypothetical protein